MITLNNTEFIENCIYGLKMRIEHFFNFDFDLFNRTEEEETEELKKEGYLGVIWFEDYIDYVVDEVDYCLEDEEDEEVDDEVYEHLKNEFAKIIANKLNCKYWFNPWKNDRLEFYQ